MNHHQERLPPSAKQQEQQKHHHHHHQQQQHHPNQDKHPVFARVHRLAVQLRGNQGKEKFELCDALAALLNNIAEEGSFLHLELSEEDAQLFRGSLDDIFGSKLSSELRRPALNLSAALFRCYGSSWLDTTPESHTLLALMTHTACIEMRVVMSRKSSFKQLEAEVPTHCFCSWLRVFHGSVHRITNDPEDTKWDPKKILSLQKCYTQTVQELITFIDMVLDEDDVETNTELREFLTAALDAITYWNLNDIESLESLMVPLLHRVVPLCARLRWTQPCLNIVARLDLENNECTKPPTSSPLIAQVWDGNEALMHFTLQSFCAELPKMKVMQDRRLVNIAHFLFVEFDSLLVSDTRTTLEQMSKTLAEWMINRGSFGLFGAQAMLHIACLIAKFCQVNVENTTPFRVYLACATQVLWAFCGFNKNNRSNKFKMPSIYKRQEEHMLEQMIDAWCDATQVLAHLVRKHRFIAEFFFEHRIAHRALTVPLVGTVEMPESMEAALQEFQQAIVTVYPEGKEELDALQEDLLLAADYKDM